MASLPQRPLALSVVSQMKDPTFATFMYQLPCGKQTAFFSSPGQEYTVVFWDGKEESRYRPEAFHAPLVSALGGPCNRGAVRTDHGRAV